MNFKSEQQAGEFSNPKLNKLLKQIVLDAEDFSLIAFNKDLYITSIWRSVEDDHKLGATGIHCLWRAIDTTAASWTDTEAQSLADRANMHYTYDPERPKLVVALFKPHKSATGPHVHWQVSINTVSK